MFRPQIQPTEDIKKSQTYLYIIFAVGIFLAFCKFVGAPSIALNEILQFSIILFGAICLNYCMVVFFVILVLFNTLMIFQLIGIQIQQQIVLGNNKLSNNNPNDIFLYTIFCITLVFNIIAVVVSFYAYKKLKNGFILNGDKINTPLQENEQNQEEDKKKDFEAFKGEGVKIGS